MDPSWCPGCDKLILPKRYVVPINPTPAPAAAAAALAPAPAAHPHPHPQPHLPAPPPPPTPSSASSPNANHPPPPPAPTPVPSSPEVHKKPVRRYPHHVYAHGGGLVHGTGRVRPGGGLKPQPHHQARHAGPVPPAGLVAAPHFQQHQPQPPQPTRTPPKALLAPPTPAAHAHDAQVVGNPTAQSHMAAHLAQQRLVAQPPAVAAVAETTPTPAQAAAPATPLPGRKTRVVISQDPTPLYCSDECRARDLKNSFIESETLGFAGASAARDRLAQFELVRQTVELTMKSRHASSASLSASASGSVSRSVPTADMHPQQPAEAYLPPILSPMQLQPPPEEDQNPPDERDAEPEPHIPPPPPNSLVDPPPPLYRTTSLPSTTSSSLSSAPLASASASQLHVPGKELNSTGADSTPGNGTTTAPASRKSTIRASKPRSRQRLPRSASATAASSLSTWGSPTKAALAPPARTLFHAASSSTAAATSSSSVDSRSSVSSGGSALFDDDAVLISEKCAGEETCGTTPSRRGSGSSAESKKKGKRVSFASDSKPGTLVDEHLDRPADVVHDERERAKVRLQRVGSEDWRRPRRRNPLLDANPLRDAVSVSPKDRVKASSLPSDLLPPNGTSLTASTRSTPALCPKVVDTPSPSRRARYSVAMWPEDEKRTTESARVHGELLRGYAKRFGPREGRSLVWGRLWEGSEADAQFRAVTSASTSPSGRGAGKVRHERQPDSRKKYWRKYEEQEAEARARRKAEAAVERLEEERVICELLGGAGMREEDQPQARRMKRMAYDGMPGPAEQRGLTYKFDRFLYPIMPLKSDIVEKKVRRFDEKSGEWIEEVMEVFERKKLFNFLED